MKRYWQLPHSLKVQVQSSAPLLTSSVSHGECYVLLWWMERSANKSLWVTDDALLDKCYNIQQEQRVFTHRDTCPVPFGTWMCSNVETILRWTCYVSGLWMSSIRRYFYSTCVVLFLHGNFVKTCVCVIQLCQLATHFSCLSLHTVKSTVRRINTPVLISFCTCVHTIFSCLWPVLLFLK